MSSAGVGLPAAAVAQVVADSACPKHAVDIAAFATCDGERVARDESQVPQISPAGALAIKAAFGNRSLLIDIRSRAEIAFVGTPAGVDAIVPFAELAQPLQWDSARREFRLVDETGFLAKMEKQVARLGGDRGTTLLLVCRSGERAAAAARLLRDAGFERVTVVGGGFEGSVGADGRRHGGWKDAGLPWTAKSDDALMLNSWD
jgi:rhodanese-related sulfurtransferase